MRVFGIMAIMVFDHLHVKKNTAVKRLRIVAATASVFQNSEHSTNNYNTFSNKKIQDRIEDVATEKSAVRFFDPYSVWLLFSTMRRFGLDTSS